MAAGCVAAIMAHRCCLRAPQPHAGQTLGCHDSTHPTVCNALTCVDLPHPVSPVTITTCSSNATGQQQLVVVSVVPHECCYKTLRPPPLSISQQQQSNTKTKPKAHTQTHQHTNLVVLQQLQQLLLGCCCWKFTTLLLDCCIARVGCQPPLPLLEVLSQVTLGCSAHACAQSARVRR